MTAVVEPRYRGSFMSLNSSVQQFAAGLAAYMGGLILGQTADGKLTHFFVAGLVSVGFGLWGIYLAKSLRVVEGKPVVGEPLTVEQV